MLGEVIIDAALGRADGLGSRGGGACSVITHGRHCSMSSAGSWPKTRSCFRSFDDQFTGRPAQGGSNGKIAAVAALLFSAMLLPAPVRRAALRLARECGVSAPASPRGVDHNSHREPPPSASGKSAARSRVMPFCASIRPGRMG